MRMIQVFLVTALLMACTSCSYEKMSSCGRQVSKDTSELIRLKGPDPSYVVFPPSNLETAKPFNEARKLEDEYKWKEAQEKFRKAAELDATFGTPWVHLGRMYRLLGEWAQALECYERAKEIFEAKKDEKCLAWVLSDIGYVYVLQGRWSEASESSKKSLDLSHRLGREADLFLVMALDNLGILYRKRGNYEKAMKYLRQSLAADASLNDRLRRACTVYEIGAVYEDQRNYAEALKNYEELLAAARELNDEPDAAEALFSIGNIHSATGRHAEAKECYDEALQLCRKFGDRPGIALKLYGMASLHSKLQEYSDALPKAREAVQLAREIGFPDRKQYERLLAKIENEVKRAPEAKPSSHP